MARFHRREKDHITPSCVNREEKLIAHREEMFLPPSLVLFAREHTEELVSRGPLVNFSLCAFQVKRRSLHRHYYAARSFVRRDFIACTEKSVGATIDVSRCSPKDSTQRRAASAAAEATRFDRRNVQLNDDSEGRSAFIADYIHLIISLRPA